MGPIGLGLSFVSIEVSASQLLSLPAGNVSVVYLVSVPRGDRVELTLPPAAAATSRLVTVRRRDARGRVLVRASGVERIEGARHEEKGPGDSGVVALQDRLDFVTFVSDGYAWLVYAESH